MSFVSDPLDRRPRLRKMHRVFVALLCVALALVVAYLGFACLLSLRKPTIRLTGDELWRRAMRFDASQEPVFPKYIDALWMDRPACDQCPQNLFDGVLTVPVELAAEVEMVDFTDDNGIERIRFLDAPPKQSIRNSRRSLLGEALGGDLPTESGWKLGAWLLLEMEPRLAAVRALATQKPLGYTPAFRFDERTTRFFGPSAVELPPQPPTEDPWFEPAHHCQDPFASMIMDLTQWFLLDARHAAHRGDGQRAVEDVAAVMGLADQLDENPSMSSLIRSMTTRKWAWHEARDLVMVWPRAFDDATLARLEALVLCLGDGPSPLRLDGPRLDIEDMLQRGFTDDGRLGESADGGVLARSAFAALEPFQGSFGSGSDEDAVPAFLLGPVLWYLMPTRREASALFQAELAQLEAECKLHPADRKPVALPPVTLSDLGHGVVARYVDQIRDTTVRLATYIEARDDARIAIACERFRRVESREPTTVADLVPMYLREAPRDPTTGLARTRLDSELDADESRE